MYARVFVKGVRPAKGIDNQGLAFLEGNKLIQMVKACKQSCTAGTECPQIALYLETGLNPQGKNHAMH